MADVACMLHTQCGWCRAVHLPMTVPGVRVILLVSKDEWKMEGGEISVTRGIGNGNLSAGLKEPTVMDTHGYT